MMVSQSVTSSSNRSMLRAITRAVSRSIERCELTHLQRTPIDLKKTRRQHLAYEAALRSLGVEVIHLAEQPDLPDSVFVEDVAIVLDECAVLTRPGAVSRQQEVESVAEALVPYRRIHRIEAPATVDGGDVLVVGRNIWIGLSSRSDSSAVSQMTAVLQPYGYLVRGVVVSGCLHLKSSVTLAAPDTLLINPAWVERSNFPGMQFIEVHPSEPSAANVLPIGETVLCQPAYPATNARLREAGLPVMLVDASELGKAEGALTCCSLIFKEIA